MLLDTNKTMLCIIFTLWLC